MARGNVSTVTRKGQVTIPIEIRRRLGVSEGDRVGFHLTDEGLFLVPIPVIEHRNGKKPDPAPSPVARTAGILSRYAEPISMAPDERLKAEKEAAALGWTERERRSLAESNRD